MESGDIAVEIAWATAERQFSLHSLRVAPGTTAVQAIEQAQALGTAVPVVDESWTLAVWGKPRPAEYALRAGDRVELLRPLRVDPKEARRQRYRREGSSR